MVGGKAGSYDIEARMAQTAGKPQRIAPVEEESLTEEGHRFAGELRAAFGIPHDGPISETMRTMLVNPGLCRVQLDLGIFFAAKSTIPVREREIAILRNAWLCGAPFEWGEHVSVARRWGVEDEAIARCTEGSAADGWSNHDRAVVRGVEELHADYCLSEATWDTLAASWNAQQMVEFPVLVGAYLTTALYQNTLRMKLTDSNPGLSAR